MLQNPENGIRATASCPRPPSRARTQAQCATLLCGEAAIIELHARCHRGDKGQVVRDRGVMAARKPESLNGHTAVCMDASVCLHNIMQGCTRVRMDAIQHVWSHDWQCVLRACCVRLSEISKLFDTKPCFDYHALLNTASISLHLAFLL